MAKSVTDLPPELLGRIFEYLGEHRPDISACRRVCKVFKELSSPFLITKIVLARRLTEIEHLRVVDRRASFDRRLANRIDQLRFANTCFTAHDDRALLRAAHRGGEPAGTKPR